MTARSEAERIWSVAELTRLIKELLEQNVPPLWVAGEVSNLTLHRSGHVYFTLKDAQSQVRCVYFSGAAKAREMNLREGDAVEVCGRLGVYEPRGEYQLVVRTLRPVGLGDLQARFEELKRKLQAEGLFDGARKKPLPLLPRCIGVVTSPTGAALRDFLNIVGRRFAGMHIRIYPARVQGDGAAAEVAAGVRYFNERDNCDVIVVTRGGGSLEDLWAFNEEVVARAVAASRIPVISAVGHEVDFTICDFAADLRAPTPSAAAELVVSRREDFVTALRQLERRLRSHLEYRLSVWRGRVQRVLDHYVLREPLHLVRQYQQRVDDLAQRAHRVLPQQLERRRLRLADLRARATRSLPVRLERERLRYARQESQLRALDPHRVLERGYAILLRERDGVAVRRPEEAPPGERLRALLAQGELAVASRERQS